MSTAEVENLIGQADNAAGQIQNIQNDMLAQLRQNGAISFDANLNPTWAAGTPNTTIVSALKSAMSSLTAMQAQAANQVNYLQDATNIIRSVGNTSLAETYQNQVNSAQNIQAYINNTMNSYNQAISVASGGKGERNKFDRSVSEGKDQKAKGPTVWYKQWWFWLIVIILFIIILWCIYKRYHKSE